MSDFDSRARTWDADPSKVERAERVAEAIRREVPVHPSMRVFEYGCGTGLLGFALQPFVKHVTLADTSSEMLAVLREKIAAQQATNMTPVQLDLLGPAVPETRYDLVCTLLTLHHIPDTDRILQRFHAVLARGGTVCVSDLEVEDGSFHGPGFDGHHGFDRADLARRLAAAGFEGIRITTPWTVARHGRDYPLFLAIARKP
jgi:ubiquinone/menaquinone biosynthesis C-methylase UbiE